MFGRQQRLNEWRQIRTVSEGIVAHWKYFSTTYRLRWYCWAILSGGWFSELRPIYQGCRALTSALARPSCYITYPLLVTLSAIGPSDEFCHLTFPAFYTVYRPTLKCFIQPGNKCESYIPLPWLLWPTQLRLPWRAAYSLVDARLCCKVQTQTSSFINWYDEVYSPLGQSQRAVKLHAIHTRYM